MRYFDIKNYLKKNRLYVWVFIIVFLIAQAGSLVFVITREPARQYVASSWFEVINGDKTINLYRGTYHKITTFEDVASVIRSNEVIREVIRDNSLDSSIENIRENIDIYEVGEMVFQLDLLWGQEEMAKTINRSIIEKYLSVIESRMDDDNSELFDVRIVGDVNTYPMGERTGARLFSSFLFSIFCGIIIILGIDFAKKISGRKRIAKGP